MYDDLKEMLRKQKFKDRYQVEFFFAKQSGDSDLLKLRRNILKLLPAMNLLLKHRSKKVQTNKWYARNEQLQQDVNNILSRFALHLNNAHQELYFFLRILRVSEKNGEGESLSLDDVTESFGEVYKQVELFDSADREKFQIFNHFRNVVFHTPFEHLLLNLTKENLHDLSDLFYDLNELKKNYIKWRGNKMNKVLISAIKANFDESEYTFNEDETSVKMRTSISDIPDR